MDLVNGFAYKAGGYRTPKEYMGLIPEDAWLVAIFLNFVSVRTIKGRSSYAISVLVLLSGLSARKM